MTNEQPSSALMGFDKRIERINQICYAGKDHFMDYVVVHHQKKKMVIAASFDIIYYWEFFILLSQVQKDEESAKLVEDRYSFRSLRLRSTPIDNGLHRTTLVTEWSSPTLVHKGIGFYAPKEPIRSLNFTEIIDKCFALEDTFPKP